MKNQTRREFGKNALGIVAASVLPAPALWAAEKKYDPGASDTEIKLGQTVPHSGPGSLYGVLGRVGEAYFQMLNDKGGINGRKIKFFTMLERIHGRIVHRELDHVSPLAVPVMLEIGRESVYGEAADELLAEAADELVKEAMG